jgi:medium-chain acyl-[acyl-carrier-protein] hydrolase
MAAGVSNEHFSRGPSPWLFLRPRPQPAALRLFCFPYSGAGASAFTAWAGEFPSDIEVCPVQLPGRETRLSEPPCRSLRELIPALARGLTPFLGRSFAFFGHSLGALVAFELARFLRRDPGLTPTWLFASAHRAPHLAGGGQVHRSSDATLARKLREINGTPAEVLENPELRALLFPILRADFELCETYAHEPGAPLSCPIAALGGLSDPHVDAEGLEAWRRHTSARLEVHRFPGDHFYLGPSRHALIRIIARRLMP